MIETEKQKTVIEVETAVICDRCHGRVAADTYEFPECFRINFTAGYSSPFGDTNRVRCELCPACFHALISEYCRIEPAT